MTVSSDKMNEIAINKSIYYPTKQIKRKYDRRAKYYLVRCCY